MKLPAPLLPLPWTGAQFPADQRRKIGDAIEAALDCGDTARADELIQLLDLADGDLDLEPCAAGDDGCHYFLCGGREGWGYVFDDNGPVPEYGVDQSKSPIGHSFSVDWGA